jgi:hypothetical protein
MEVSMKLMELACQLDAERGLSGPRSIPSIWRGRD